MRIDENLQQSYIMWITNQVSQDLFVPGVSEVRSKKEMAILHHFFLYDTACTEQFQQKRSACSIIRWNSKYLYNRGPTNICTLSSIFTFNVRKLRLLQQMFFCHWCIHILTGVVILDLPALPRPAKSAKKCTMKIMEKGAPTLNLFKIKRTKGWWPFRGSSTRNKESELTVSIEWIAVREWQE